MKILACIIALITTSFGVAGQDIQGQWNGTLEVQGIQLRIVFHIDKTGDLYEATMDSPDQKVSGIRVTATNFNSPDVKFEISTIGVIYRGTLSGNRIEGTWMQSGQSFPLAFMKSETTSD